MIYLVVKSLHIISIIAWMAGLLYLPRLMVYHAGENTPADVSNQFKVMERRLLKYIMTPAMIASWIFGLFLAIYMSYVVTWPTWFIIKVILVLSMTVVHFMLAYHVSEFARDSNHRPQVYFRFLNEIPTVLMIGIVFAVVLKDI